MKNFKNLGKSLSRTEMKSISGGLREFQEEGGPSICNKGGCFSNSDCSVCGSGYACYGLGNQNQGYCSNGL